MNKSIRLILISNSAPSYLAKMLDMHNNIDLDYLSLISNEKPEFYVDDYKFFRDCTFGTHEANNLNLVPLDDKLLSEFANVQTEFMQMMERYENYSSLIVYENRLNLYHFFLQYWFSYIIQHKINLLFSTTIPHAGYDFIIYSICKYLNIQVIMFQRIPLVIPGNVSIYSLTDIKQHIPELASLYKKYYSQSSPIKLNKRISSYLVLQETNVGKTFTRAPDYNVFRYAYIFVSSRFIAYKRLKKYIRAFDFFSRVKQIARTRSAKPRLMVHPNMSDKFVLLALHFQPEASTSPLGGHFVHQDFVLSLLQNALPNDVKIYVKAHPRGGFSSKFLCRYKEDGRTILIDPKINSLQIIKSSLAVATVTGTAGWEAFLNKKPVLMFGHYFYSSAPGVFSVRSVEDIKNAIDQILNPSFVINDKMVTSYLRALQDTTFPGWVDHAYRQFSDLSVEQNNINIFHSILSHLGIPATKNLD
jgi:hypothetical protein